MRSFFSGRLAAALLASAFLFLTGGLAAAQVGPQGYPVQQGSQRLDATVQYASATGAGNTSVVATLTPLSGQSIYVTWIDLEIAANAAVTGAAVVQSCVTAGLPSNLTFMLDNSTLTAGQLKTQPYQFATPLKANNSAAFTVTCSGMQSTQTFRVNLAGYSAP